MTNLEIIKQACIKANPENELNWAGDYGNPIRLADVLLAIWDKRKTWQMFGLSEKGLVISQNEDIEESYFWNLHNDSLEAQSPETLDFIAGLIKETV